MSRTLKARITDLEKNLNDLVTSVHDLVSIVRDHVENPIQHSREMKNPAAKWNNEDFNASHWSLREPWIPRFLLAPLPQEGCGLSPFLPLFLFKRIARRKENLKCPNCKHHPFLDLITAKGNAILLFCHNCQCFFRKKLRGWKLEFYNVWYLLFEMLAMRLQTMPNSY